MLEFSGNFLQNLRKHCCCSNMTTLCMSNKYFRDTAWTKFYLSTFAFFSYFFLLFYTLFYSPILTLSSSSLSISTHVLHIFTHILTVTLSNSTFTSKPFSLCFFTPLLIFSYIFLSFQLKSFSILSFLSKIAYSDLARSFTHSHVSAPPNQVLCLRDTKFFIIVIDKKNIFLHFPTTLSHGQCSCLGEKWNLFEFRRYTLRVHIRRTVTDCKNSRNRWTETVSSVPRPLHFSHRLFLYLIARTRPRFSFHRKKVKSDCCLSP